jgi:hypothetical protein
MTMCWNDFHRGERAGLQELHQAALPLEGQQQKKD